MAVGNESLGGKGDEGRAHEQGPGMRFMHGVNGGKRLVIKACHWSDDRDWASIGCRVICMCGTVGKNHGSGLGEEVGSMGTE